MLFKKRDYDADDRIGTHKYSISYVGCHFQAMCCGSSDRTKFFEVISRQNETCMQIEYRGSA